MVYSQTKNPNLGKFWRAIDWKLLIYFREYFTDIWDILLPFGTFCVHMVDFFRFGYHAPRNIWQPCFKHFPFEILIPTTFSLNMKIPACFFALCIYDFCLFQ
jgi:hypothetical protein